MKTCSPEFECLKPVLERKHAIEAAQRGRSKDRSSTAYRCVDCGGWHVGTSNGMKKKSRTLYTNHQLT